MAPLSGADLASTTSKRRSYGGNVEVFTPSREASLPSSLTSNRSCGSGRKRKDERVEISKEGTSSIIGKFTARVIYLPIIVSLDAGGAHTFRLSVEGSLFPLSGGCPHIRIRLPGERGKYQALRDNFDLLAPVEDKSTPLHRLKQN